MKKNLLDAISILLASHEQIDHKEFDAQCMLENAVNHLEVQYYNAVFESNR